MLGMVSGTIRFHVDNVDEPFSFTSDFDSRNETQEEIGFRNQIADLVLKSVCSRNQVLGASVAPKAASASPTRIAQPPGRNRFSYFWLPTDTQTVHPDPNTQNTISPKPLKP